MESSGTITGQYTNFSSIERSGVPEVIEDQLTLSNRKRMADRANHIVLRLLCRLFERTSLRQVRSDR
jgi:hypothetical protein